MRAVLAFFFIVLLVIPLSLAAMSLAAVSSWVLDPVFYSNALKSPGVYDALLSDQMLTQFTTQMFGTGSQVDAPSLREVTKNFMSLDFMGTQINSVVNQLFDYLNGKTAALDLKLNFTEMKAIFMGGKQTEALTKLANMLPVCKEGQIVRPEALGFYVCRPSFLKVDDFLIHYLLPSIEGFIQKLPDEISITPNILTSEQTNQWRVWIPGGSLQTALMIALVLLSVATLGFWLLAGMVASQVWSSRLRWMGFALLIPGLIILILGLLTLQDGFLMPLIKTGIEHTGISQDLPFIPEVSQALTQAALPRVSSSFLMVGGIASSVAVALIFWGFSIRPKLIKATLPVEAEKKE
jgi:hypothetical protein